MEKVTQQAYVKDYHDCFTDFLGRFPLTRKKGQIVESNTKHLGFGRIWPENLDNIRMRSVYARYVRNIGQMFPLIQRNVMATDTHNSIA
jgi:hypothetical protein